MCPLAFFGIHGALVSGKIAAVAVYDPEKAVAEMNKMTSNFLPAYNMYVQSKNMAHKDNLNLRRQILKDPSLLEQLPQAPAYAIAGLIDRPPGPTPKYIGAIGH
jgi:hypothetical protein